MTKRKRKRLYRQAQDAYYEGALVRARELEHDAPIPPEGGGRSMYGMGRNALEVAWYAGHAADHPLQALSGPLPTRVWADVLAEALRP